MLCLGCPIDLIKEVQQFSLLKTKDLAFPYLLNPTSQTVLEFSQWSEFCQLLGSLVRLEVQRYKCHKVWRRRVCTARLL